MRKLAVEKTLNMLLLPNHKGLIFDINIDEHTDGFLEITLLLDGTDQEQEWELEEEISNYLSLLDVKPNEWSLNHVVYGDEGWDYSDEINESVEDKDALQIFIDEFNDDGDSSINSFFGNIENFVKYVLRKNRIDELDSDILSSLLLSFSDKTFGEIYKFRPEIFERWSSLLRLNNLGLAELPDIDYNFTLDLDPDDVQVYVDGDWVLSRRKVKKKTPAGGEYETTVETRLFETILAGETWELWNSYENNWKIAITYYIDNESEKKIWEIVNRVANTEGIDIEGLDLEEAISEVDDGYDIRSALGSALSDAEAEDYVNYLSETLKDCLEEYGNVTKFDDTGVTIEINMDKFIADVDTKYMDGYFEDCGYEDMRCIFDELRGNDWIEKPKFDVDDRWTPDVDEKYFNELLLDRLNEI